MGGEGGVKVCWGTGVKGVCVLWGEKGGGKEKKTKKNKQVLHHPHGVIHMQAHTHKNV